MPVILLLLFVGVFGHALSAGLGTPLAGGQLRRLPRPGILVMTAGFAAEATAVNVCTDMTRASSPGSAPWPSPAARC